QKELKAAYQGYYAYFGTYEVNEADGMILHRVRASLWPREVGIEYRRHVVLTGDRLVFDDSTVSGGGRAAAESVDLGAREVGVTSRWRAGSSNQAVGPTAETAAGHRQR